MAFNTDIRSSLAEIAKAMARDEFVFHYQPKVSMVTGKVCGSEALIRWQRPDGSVTLPGQFIPVCEKTGFISEITAHMLPKLLDDLTLMLDVEPSLGVSFNTSAHDFTTPRLTDLITCALKDRRIDPRALEVELTEASLFSEDRGIQINLNRLRDLQVSLAMDDFGTGFSSIDMLGKVPYSTIKLDHHLIKRANSSNKDAMIVQTTIRLAHKIGINLVAEGIEDGNTYHLLLNSGCTHAQGHWISPPLALIDLLAFVRSRKRWPALPVGLLHMAELDHIEWRKAIMDAIFLKQFQNQDPGTAAEPYWPELDANMCGFGKWYAGPGRQFSGNPWYDHLAEPHQRLHHIGKCLKEAIQHQNRTLDEVTKLIRDLSTESATIVHLLQGLQDDYLLGSPDFEAGFLLSLLEQSS